MAVTVYESDLPGVGKKHEIALADGTRLVVVTHNTGRREVYRRGDADADSEKLVELTDDEARTVGTVLEGAYFQPVASADITTLLGPDAALDWVDVAADSDLVGSTLAEANVRAETGVSVLAIQRGDETLPNPARDTRIETGDTLVILGSPDACQHFVSRYD